MPKPAKATRSSKAAPVSGRRTKGKGKTGRPTAYTPKLAERICNAVLKDKRLRDICGKNGIPDKATVMRWAQTNIAFRDQLRGAMEALMLGWEDELLTVTDDKTSDIQRLRLKSDNMKWLMAKRAPKRYGDKAALEVTGEGGGPVEVKDMSDPHVRRDLGRRVAFILADAVRADQEIAESEAPSAPPPARQGQRLLPSPQHFERPMPAAEAP